MGRSWTVPLGGNAFVTPWTNDNLEVHDGGFGNWISEKTTCSVFFYVTKPGPITLSLNLKVGCLGKSRIKVSLKSNTNVLIHEVIVDIQGDDYHTVGLGSPSIDKTGYYHLELQGVSKTAVYFADVASLIITCEGEIRCVADDFHFGRRGPSVHLNYTLPICKCIQYFYNEITVPAGQDALGAYFCAAAFQGGYFGMQVNSESERRILFSIWSPYNTDDPAQVPEQYRVRLARKGENVQVGNFGNEGSGAQSYLKYIWKAGSTYKFLVQGVPLPTNICETLFSAWFWAPQENKWHFIASFIRPKEGMYLRDVYSFSENFLPKTGHIERKALYSNQWANDLEGKWHEITQAQFTGDATSKKNRHDFAGGLEEDAFFLKNCGFFNEKVETGQSFRRKASGCQPDIKFNKLP